MSSRFHRKRITRLLASLALASACSQAVASGFQILEQNVTNLGLAYAGTAALAEDASHGWYNAASLTRLCAEQGVALSGVLIFPDSDLRVDAATPTFNAGSFSVFVPFRTGSGGVEAHGSAFVPAIHYFARICDSWVFGLSIAAPYGLKVNYDSNSLARYMSTRNELRSVDISPSIAYSFCNGFSIGAGVDIVYAQAKLDQALGFGFTFLPNVTPLPGGPSLTAFQDGYQYNTADDWGFGGHIGILWELDECTRFGLNYRSEVKLDLDGESETLLPAALRLSGISTAGTVTVQGVSADLKLPATATFSVYRNFCDCFALMADVSWTNWKKINKIELEFDDGSTLTEELNFRDTYRVALGASYQIDPCWQVKAGVAYDKSPVRDSFRTTHIPDSNRTWGAFGLQWRFAKCGALEFGYAHLWFKDAPINEVAPVAVPSRPLLQSLRGEYDTHADLVGLQLTWDL